MCINRIGIKSNKNAHRRSNRGRQLLPHDTLSLQPDPNHNPDHNSNPHPKIDPNPCLDVVAKCFDIRSCEMS